MKRFLSPRLSFLTRTLSATVIELDDAGRFVRLIPMAECSVEPAQTIYIEKPLTWDGQRLMIDDAEGTVISQVQA